MSIPGNPNYQEPVRSACQGNDLPTLVKAAGATLDYRLDASDWLTDSDTITDASWAGDPLTVSGAVIESGALAVKAFIAGGTAGEREAVTVTITTSGGRIRPCTFFLDIV